MSPKTNKQQKKGKESPLIMFNREIERIEEEDKGIEIETHVIEAEKPYAYKPPYAPINEEELADTILHFLKLNEMRSTEKGKKALEFLNDLANGTRKTYATGRSY